MNLNAKISDELNDAFEKACIDRKLYKKEGVEVALNEFIEKTKPRKIPFACPACAAQLEATATAEEVVSLALSGPVVPAARVQISDSERTIDVSAETLDLVKGLDALLTSTDEKNTLLAKWLKAELKAIRSESE